MSYEQDAMFKKQLDFQYQIYEQIQKIRTDFTQDIEATIIDLQVLQAMLSPYLTHKYSELLAQIDDVEATDNIKLLELLLTKFRVLLHFLDEKGLLLEREGVATI